MIDDPRRLVPRAAGLEPSVRARQRWETGRLGWLYGQCPTCIPVGTPSTRGDMQGWASGSGVASRRSGRVTVAVTVAVAVRQGVCGAVRRALAERERDRDRDRQRQTETERQRQRDRETERQTERDK